MSREQAELQQIIPCWLLLLTWLSPGGERGTVSLLLKGMQRVGHTSDPTVEEVAGWPGERGRRKARWQWFALGELVA